MRVLLISYHFPPDAAIGAVRPYQFARLLPEHGIETWVLTVQPQFAELRDDRLTTDDIPADHIVRTAVYPTKRRRLIKLAAALKTKLKGGSANHSNGAAPAISKNGASGGASAIDQIPWRQRWFMSWVFFPDNLAGWYKPAHEAAEKMLRQTKFDAIISTSPPRVAHFLAYDLSLRYKLPWIMDLRDPWFKDIDEVHSKTLDDLYHRLFLRYSSQADAVVMNTERLREYMVKTVPSIANKAVTIPNGAKLKPRANKPALDKPAQFRVGHYGSVYSTRSAQAFLEGLRLWLDRSKINPAEVAVRFMGPEFGSTPYHVERLKLESIVTLCPPVSRDRVTELMREDYILLLLANDQPLQIPGKLYEYLAVERRILASTEADGASADLIRGRPGCSIVQTAEDMANALTQYWQEYEQGSSAEIDYGDLLRECSYERRVESLAKVIESVTNQQPVAKVGGGFVKAYTEHSL
ncbi:MAG: glycosyltransferase [Abitibacteriaceae bacterium]|nr:glycosyltransferase [Abditibacteriaceae bacterium]MBV9868596.1 glycosyltransferase [Abditibacteriaceae bacterium]